MPVARNHWQWNKSRDGRIDRFGGRENLPTMEVLRYLVKEIVEDRFEQSLEARAVLCRSLGVADITSISFDLVDVPEVDPELVVPVTQAAAAYLEHGGLVSALHYLAGLLYLEPDQLQELLGASDPQIQALGDNLNVFLDGWNELRLGKYRLPLDGKIYVKESAE